MNLRRLLSAVLLPLCCAVALGCQNPGSVRQLATTTAANVTTIQSGIAALAEESRRVTEARANNVARQHGVVTRLRADVELDKEVLVRSGSAKSVATAKDLAVWSKKIVKTFASAEGAEKALRKQLIDQHEALEQRKSDLSTAARMLAELGEDVSFKDRLKFIGGYLKEVGKRVEASRDSSAASGKAAEAKIDAKGGGK